MTSNVDTSAENIQRLERLNKALELRKAGASLQSISDQLGFGSKGSVHRFLSKHMEELRSECTETIDTLRTLHRERLGSMLLSLWRRKDNPEVARTILKILEREAKLEGLDAPFKQEITPPLMSTGPGSYDIDITKLSIEHLKQFQEILRVAGVKNPEEIPANG